MQIDEYKVNKDSRQKRRISHFFCHQHERAFDSAKYTRIIKQMGGNIWNRRHFLKQTAGTLGYLSLAPYLHAALPQTDNRILKIGLVGCGGRGLGAIQNALDADPNTIVWALADVFEERTKIGNELLTKQYSGRVQLDKSRIFHGLDCYKKILETDIDIVLLCTPPAFRPEQLAAAIAANKHIYAEKPIAVDVPGVMSVLESAQLAKKKNLVILDGFCWRYDEANQEAHRKISSGEQGRVLAFEGLYYTSPPKSPLALDSRPASDTDVVWALRNWTAWNWLSGGQFVEQVVHTIDGMVWSFNEKMPLAAYGSGGRAQRRDDGDVWDHYDVYFEYENNVTAHISCRQWVGCHGNIVDRTICEKGILITPIRPQIQAETRWRFRGERGNMYANTHIAFYKLLRSGTFTQTLESAANKTLIAILGREAAHTGQRITWEQIKLNHRRLVPEDLTLDTPLPPAQIPRPGRRAI